MECHPIEAKDFLSRFRLSIEFNFSCSLWTKFNDNVNPDYDYLWSIYFSMPCNLSSLVATCFRRFKQEKERKFRIESNGIASKCCNPSTTIKLTTKITIRRSVVYSLLVCVPYSLVTI